MMRSLIVVLSLVILSLFTTIQLSALVASASVEGEPRTELDIDIYDNDDGAFSLTPLFPLIEPRVDDESGADKPNGQGIPKEDQETDPTVVEGLQAWMQNERLKQQAAHKREGEAMGTRKDLAKAQSKGRETHTAGIQRGRDALKVQQDANQALKDSRQNVINLASSSKIMRDRQKNFAPLEPNELIGDKNVYHAPAALKLFMQNQHFKEGVALNKASEARKDSKKSYKARGDLIKALQTAKGNRKNIENLGLSTKELGDEVKEHALLAKRPGQSYLGLQRGRLFRDVQFREPAQAKEMGLRLRQIRAARKAMLAKDLLTKEAKHFHRPRPVHWHLPPEPPAWPSRASSKRSMWRAQFRKHERRISTLPTPLGSGTLLPPKLEGSLPKVDPSSFSSSKIAESPLSGQSQSRSKNPESPSLKISHATTSKRSQSPLSDSWTTFPSQGTSQSTSSSRTHYSPARPRAKSGFPERNVKARISVSKSVHFTPKVSSDRRPQYSEEGRGPGTAVPQSQPQKEPQAGNKSPRLPSKGLRRPGS